MPDNNLRLLRATRKRARRGDLHWSWWVTVAIFATTFVWGLIDVTRRLLR